MRKRTIVLLSATAAALTLAAAVSSASANRLSVNTTSIYIEWVELALLNDIGAEPVVCEVTLLGSFHTRTIQKIARTLVGVITHARIENPDCENGSATVLRLPWHITYESFEGRLPLIESFTLLLNGIETAIFNEEANATCLVLGSAGNNAAGIATVNGSGVATELIADDRALDTNDTTGSLCDLFDVDGIFEGVASVENGSGGSVVVRLI